MTKFGSYLLFDGNCKEALNFYKECLGGELDITTVGESTMSAQFPSDKQNKIVHAQLQSGPIEITASDWLHPTRILKQGNTVCLYISRATNSELKKYFNKLSEGADPSTIDKLVDMPFGAYGALTDKHGIRWMFQGDKAT
ncbi:MAG TPA: VOC family protein [Patescibacteria group bacterium]|nr:VOC family protein [Patescibacteria group bacterium]